MARLPSRSSCRRRQSTTIPSAPPPSSPPMPQSLGCNSTISNSTIPAPPPPPSTSPMPQSLGFNNTISNSTITIINALTTNVQQYHFRLHNNGVVINSCISD
uniref:Uncharacterized protein n=1 Tax=Solanum tuberosum TaxID=4113 RepID=M1D917_SOLTU